MIQRLPKIAFDRTEPNDDVLSRSDRLGRFASVLIREGVHGDVREIGLNLFRNMIDERDHSAGMASFGVVEGFAFGTFTPACPIVLRDRNNFSIWRFVQP